jgi:hypothetical protein
MWTAEAAGWTDCKVTSIPFTLPVTTVDDTNSTVWTFVGGWSAVTATTPCSTCFAQPDPQQVFNSSWHDGSVVSGSVTFQGSPQELDEFLLAFANSYSQAPLSTYTELT